MRFVITSVALALLISGCQSESSDKPSTERSQTTSISAAPDVSSTEVTEEVISTDAPGSPAESSETVPLSISDIPVVTLSSLPAELSPPSVPEGPLSPLSGERFVGTASTQSDITGCSRQDGRFTVTLTGEATGPITGPATLTVDATVFNSEITNITVSFSVAGTPLVEQHSTEVIGDGNGYCRVDRAFLTGKVNLILGTDIPQSPAGRTDIAILAVSVGTIPDATAVLIIQ